MRNAAIVAAVAAAATLTVVPLRGQQAPPPTAGMVIKGKAPVSNEILKVKLPKPQMATLANGLQLMVLEDHRLPRVSFQIIIPGAGGYYDPAPMIGLSSYTAQMMREGTKAKTSPQPSRRTRPAISSSPVGSSTRSTSARARWTRCGRWRKRSARPS